MSDHPERRNLLNEELGHQAHTGVARGWGRWEEWGWAAAFPYINRFSPYSGPFKRERRDLSSFTAVGGGVRGELTPGIT